MVSLNRQKKAGHTPQVGRQGGPLSPLLSNILLDDLDKELEKRGLRFVRYADDFLVFTKSEAAAKRVYESLGNYLTRKLRLVVNHQKSQTCSTDGVEFLGFIFHGYGGKIRVSPKKVKRFKDRVREITRRNRGVSMQTRQLPTPQPRKWKRGHKSISADDTKHNNICVVYNDTLVLCDSLIFSGDKALVLSWEF